MFFWFKRKKIILDCFTSEALAFDRHKPQKAVHSLPDWYRQLKPGVPNMKYCHGFKQFFKNAISLNMWTTLDFTVNTEEKKWDWRASLPSTIISEHSPEQYGYFLSEKDYDHIKLDSPWALKTNKYVNFAWVDSFWCRNTFDYMFPNTILDFYYQHTTAINMFFRLHGPSYTFKIEAGDPLIFLIPLTEEKIEIRHHLITHQEMLRYMPYDVGSTSQLMRYWIRKKHTDKLLNQQKKCPFGFGS